MTGAVVRNAAVTRSAVVSSVAAPVLLIGGWTIAATRQRSGFEAVTQSISALAGLDADERWIMGAALAGVGVCHVVTAAGLRAAATPGRALLAVGGVGTVAVAVFPLPADDGSSLGHAVAAGVAFGALAAWPAAAGRRDAGRRDADRRDADRRDAGRCAAGWGLRRPVTLGAAGVLLALLGWFVSQLGGGQLLGLTERVAAGAQAGWPCVVVLSCLKASRSR